MATKILIAFYSRNGATEALAKRVAEGARAAGAQRCGCAAPASLSAPR